MRRAFAVCLLAVFAFLTCSCENNKGIPQQPDYGNSILHETAPAAGIGTPLLSAVSENKVYLAPESTTHAEFSFSWMQRMTGDNNIDRAFSRILLERGDELDNNTVLAYLYALKWKEEFNFISSELYSYEQQHRLLDEEWIGTAVLRHPGYYAQTAAMEYARQSNRTLKAIDIFAGIARYYRLMTYDCISRFDEYYVTMEMQTDENELYQFLSDFPSYEPIQCEDYIYDYKAIYGSIIPMVIVAELPDEDIRVTSAPPFGSVLSVRGNEYLYNWESGVQTPREIYPFISLFDYDGDGVDELAVVVCTGYGTECYEEMLVIVEINESMRATSVTGETIESLLYHRLSGSYDDAAEEVIIRLDDQIIHIDWEMERLRNNLEYAYEGNPEFTGFDVRSLIWFSVNNGNLSVEVHIGYFLLFKFMPSDYFRLTADITYDGENFEISLTNCLIWSTD